MLLLQIITLPTCQSKYLNQQQHAGKKACIPKRQTYSMTLQYYRFDQAWVVTKSSRVDKNCNMVLLALYPVHHIAIITSSINNTLFVLQLMTGYKASQMVPKH